MKATELYKQLEKDFITPSLSDDWAQYMQPLADFLSDNFKKRSMGLVCDNTQEINKVYTAVFPSDNVMSKILDRGETDIMLFIHHPKAWDIRTTEVFLQMNINLLQKFKARRIAIYNLHSPLDNYGKYSTSVTFANALGVEPEKAFAPYLGGLSGVFGRTECQTVHALRKNFELAVNHTTSLYQYGVDEITNGMVAVVAGGGIMVEVLEEMNREGVNTMLTGLTRVDDHSQNGHDYAKENKINILGGTHYSTEKFACIEICAYFLKLGLDCEFIEDAPILEDL